MASMQLKYVGGCSFWLDRLGLQHIWEILVLVVVVEVYEFCFPKAPWIRNDTGPILLNEHSVVIFGVKIVAVVKIIQRFCDRLLLRRPGALSVLIPRQIAANELPRKAGVQNCCKNKALASISQLKNKRNTTYSFQTCNMDC